MKIALLNPVYWPEVRRGSERFARSLADGLIARGNGVQLITSHRGRPTTTVEDGLEVVRVWRPPIENRLRRRLYEEHLAHVPLSYLALRRSGADVVNALYPTDAMAALRHRNDTGTPAVLSYMGIPHRVSLANRRQRKEIVAKACRECDAVVALSEVAAEGFRTWLGVDPHVIAPPVDVEAFTPAPERRSDVPTFLCAADHTQPRKRVGLLVDAFTLLRAEQPEARLLLSRGAAPSVWAHVAGVDEIDLNDRAALVEANQQAWVAVLPSWGEAFGLVLAEALACGTPVVGGQAEVVGSKDTGRLFDGDDPEVLKAELLSALALAEDPRTASRCRARAEQWSTAACAGAYEALYASVS